MIITVWCGCCIQEVISRRSVLAEKYPENAVVPPNPAWLVALFTRTTF